MEFKAHDLEHIKTFYKNAFGWSFTDYGPDYTAFSGSGLSGGFAKSDQPVINGVLVVLYHENLEEISKKVVANGGTITVPVFSFPGGRRFHFSDPSGNELAIWSE